MVPHDLTWILHSKQRKTEREYVIRHGKGSYTVGMKTAFGRGFECKICYKVSLACTENGENSLWLQRKQFINLKSCKVIFNVNGETHYFWRKAQRCVEKNTKNACLWISCGLAEQMPCVLADLGLLAMGGGNHRILFPGILTTSLIWTRYKNLWVLITLNFLSFPE